MAEARVQRRLTAILAADVAGYSRLMGADEEGTLAALKALRRGLTRPSGVLARSARASRWPKPGPLDGDSSGSARRGRIGLPPCSACHGARTGGPIETPTLTGQYAQYIEAQLKAFASGTRHNDIYHRMRSVAAKLTSNEIRLLAIYYSGQ